jgi:hypothetical protein
MFNFRTGLRSLVSLTLLATLAACGGGGGGGGSSTPTTPSTTTFPIAAAFNNIIINGFQASLTITGKASGISVSGSGTITYAPAAAATFEGQAAQAQTQTFAGTVSGNGNTVPITVSDTVYYDSNYNELGDVDSDEYSVTTAWHPLPTAAHVNDAGEVDAITSYSDQTKSTVTGYSTSSYTIDSDSATSVILHVTIKVYDENHTLTETDQYRYRVDTAGNIFFVSADTTEDSSNTIHFAAQ